MKKCMKCGEVKPADQFYRHPGMADGRLSKCKTCTKRDVRENRARNIDYYRAFDRARAMAPHRVKARSEYRKTEAGKAAVARASRKYVETNPIKRKAHIAVGNALRDGKLKRGNCEICGNPKAQAHHDDYSKPLDVRWLCTTHHAEWHKHNTPLCPDQEQAA
jgi:hypothetical protein